MKLVNDIEKLTKSYYLVDFVSTENERLKTFSILISQIPLRRQRVYRQARSGGQELGPSGEDCDDSVHPLHQMHQVRVRGRRMRRPGNDRTRKQHAGMTCNTFKLNFLSV